MKRLNHLPKDTKGLNWFSNQNISHPKSQAFGHSPVPASTHMPKFKISKNQIFFKPKDLEALTKQ